MVDSHQDTEALSPASVELSPINGNVSDFQEDLPPVKSSYESTALTNTLIIALYNILVKRPR